MINPEALRKNIEVRIELGYYKPPHKPTEAFYDLSYWSEATGEPVPPPAGMPRNAVPGIGGRYHRSKIAAQSVVLHEGLLLCRRLALDQRAGGEVADHLAVLVVKPIDNVFLLEGNDLAKLH